MTYSWNSASFNTGVLRRDRSVISTKSLYGSHFTVIIQNLHWKRQQKEKESPQNCHQEWNEWFAIHCIFHLSPIVLFVLFESGLDRFGLVASVSSYWPSHTVSLHLRFLSFKSIEYSPSSVEWSFNLVIKSDPMAVKWADTLDYRGSRLGAIPFTLSSPSDCSTSWLFL